MELLLLLVFSLALRLVFLVSNHYGGAGDADFHLWNIRLRGQLKNIGKHQCQDSILDGYRGYPPLPHEILRFFPKKYQVMVGRLLNSGYDLVSITLVYFVSQYLFAYYWQTSGLSLSLAPEFVAALIFATTPILFPRTSRLISIGGRPIGLTLNIVYFLLLFLVIDGHIYIIVGSILVGLLIILSSQFGMQNMVGVSVLASVFSLSPTPLLVMGLVFASGLLIPFLGIKQLLVRKVAHYKWYIKNQDTGTTATGRNSVSALFRSLSSRDISALIFQLVDKTTPVIALYSIPLLFILIAVFIINKTFFTAVIQDPFLFHLAIIILADISLFILTSLRPLRFIGEAERYLEYCNFAVAILFTYYLYTSAVNISNIIISIILFQVTIILLTYIYNNSSFVKSLRLPSDKNLLGVVQFLDVNDASKIMTIPTKLSYLLSTVTKPKHKYYYPMFYETGRGLEYMNEDHVRSYFVKPDLEYFSAKYGISLVVVKKRPVENVRKYVDYKLDTLLSVYENQEYAVYRLTEVDRNKELGSSLFAMENRFN